MARFKIRKASVEKVKRNLQAYIKKKRRHFELGIIVWADGTISEIQGQLASVGAFDQGILSASTQRTDPEWKGSKLKIVVFNPMEYALTVEFGRKPGGRWPPINSLVGWAKRKGIISTLSANVDIPRTYRKEWMTAVAITKELWISRKGGGKNKKSEAIDPIVRDLVILRLIQKKIGMKGTKGRHPFTIAFERRLPSLKREVADTMKMLK